MESSAAIVAVSQYDSYPPLLESGEIAAKIASDLEASGVSVARDFLDGGDSAEISRGLRDWIAAAEDGSTLILFWSGHGVADPNGHFLACRTTPARKLDSVDAVRALELGSMLAKSRAEKMLVVFDTCYSGQAASDAVEAFAAFDSTSLPISGRSRALSIIASAHPLERAQEGLFASHFRAVLMEPDADRDWNDGDEVIRADQIANAILKRCPAGESSSITCPEYGVGKNFVPNPRFTLRLSAGDVETGRRVALELDMEHFLRSSRGIEVGEAGWYFTGRTGLLGRLVRWLETAKRGVTVVTGPPGAGKSAVVGRITALSTKVYRDAAERLGFAETADPSTIPPAGIVDVAIHAAGKTLKECAGLVARGLELSADTSGWESPARVVEGAGALGRRLTIVLDALDEARRGEAQSIARLLILPLSELPNVRVLVGSRRSLDGAVIPDGENRHDRLRAAFGADAIIEDLADEPDSIADIGDYVERRLMDGVHKDRPAEVAAAAKRVADSSEGIFLYARIVSRTLQDQPHIAIDRLPDSATDAFVQDLGTRFAEDRKRVDDMLRALAWSPKTGLSRGVWPKVATALARDAEYSDEDAAWVLANVGWHIVESSVATDGVHQATFRLNHQAFVDHYRKGASRVRIHRTIAEAIAKGISKAGWFEADPYLRRDLAAHAGAGGVLDRFLGDPGFLACAEPLSLALELRRTKTKRGARFAKLYLRVLDQLVDLKPLERMPLTEMFAKMTAPSLSEILAPCADTAWSCRWADWSPPPPSSLFAGGDSGVAMVVAAALDPHRLVAALAREDGGLEVWDVKRRERLTLFEAPVGESASAVAIAQTSAGAFLVGAWEGRYLGALNLDTGEWVTRLFDKDWERTFALCIVEVDGRPRCVAAHRNLSMSVHDLADLEMVVDRPEATKGSIYGLRPMDGGNRARFVSVSDHVRKQEKVDRSSVRLWSAGELELLWEDGLDREDLPHFIEPAEHLGKGIVVLSQNSWQPCQIWNIETGELLFDGEDACEHAWVCSFMGSDWLLEARSGRIHLSRIERDPGTGRLSVIASHYPPIELGGTRFSGIGLLDGRSMLLAPSRTAVRIWDLDELLGDLVLGEPLPQPEAALGASAAALAASPDDPGLIYVGASDAVIALDADTGGLVWEHPLKARVTALAVEPGGEGLAAAADGQLVTFRPAKSGRIERSIELGTAQVSRLRLAIWEGARLAFLSVGRREWSVAAWDLEKGEEVSTLLVQQDERRRFRFQLSHGEQDKKIEGLAVFEDGEDLWVAFASRYSKVTVGKFGDQLIDPIWLRDSTLHIPNGQNEYVPALDALSCADGHLLAAATDYGGITIWNRGDWEVRASLQAAHFESVKELRFGRLRGQDVLASAGVDGAVRIWTTALEPLFAVGLDCPIVALAWLGEDRLAVGGPNGRLVIDFH